MMIKANSTHAFLGLDALRGVAAIVIAVGHAGALFGAHPGSGYLAVDLFFVLSGFVLAHAYDRRIKGGMGPAQFMRIRMIRLYPLYFLGLIVVAVGIVIDLAIAQHANWTASALLVSSVLAVGFLPTPPHIAPRLSLYPLNTPAWSLAFELIVNFAFVVTWKRLSTRVLYATTIIAGVALIVTAFTYGSLGVGADFATWPGGFPRVFFSFPVGVLVFRLHLARKPLFQVGTVIPVLVMLVALLVEPSVAARPAYDLFCVMVVFPWVVMAGAAVRPTKLAGSFAFLGAISYAFYVLHFPILEMVLALLKRLTHDRISSLQPFSGIAFICLTIAIAYLADICIDTPVRRWLSRRTRRPALLGTGQ